MNFPHVHSTLTARECYALVAAFVFVRFILIGGLYVLTGGKELASDVVFHELIIGDPLGILNGTAEHIASYPPFQWLIEWSLFSLYNMHFGEMISYRMLMVTVEFFAFIVAIAVCRKAGVSRVISYTMLVLFIVSPHQYFASVFFIQEDVIAQLFMLIALFFLLDGKRTACIVTLIAGVLIAKLFFVVPLFYVLLFQGNYLFRRRVVEGTLSLIPLVFVYWFIINSALINGGEVPIRDFTPDAKYAANYWVLLIGSDPVLLVFYKNISLLLTTAVQLCLIAALLLIDRKNKPDWHPAILLAIPLAFFFATFYQHMPEYLLMLWPVVALLGVTVWQQLVFAAALSFAWAPRIFHGLTTVVQGFGTEAEARTEIVGPLISNLNIDFALLNQAALVAQTIVYTMLVIWLCILGKRLQQRARID